MKQLDIFGNAAEYSDGKAAELKAAAEVTEWPLLRHEQEIIEELNKQDYITTW